MAPVDSFLQFLMCCTAHFSEMPRLSIGSGCDKHSSDAAREQIKLPGRMNVVVIQFYLYTLYITSTRPNATLQHALPILVRHH